MARAGEVIVFADNNASLADGASIKASGYDGGFVEFSAKNIVSISGGLGLNASANGGINGQILIDPTELIWEGSGKDFYSAGADITLDAEDKIRLSNVYLISRNLGAGATTRGAALNDNSIGNSGNITLTTDSGIIELVNGTKLLSSAKGGNFQAGNISILGKTITLDDAVLNASRVGGASGKISINAIDEGAFDYFNGSEGRVASISILNNSEVVGGDVYIKAHALSGVTLDDDSDPEFFEDMVDALGHFFTDHSLFVGLAGNHASAIVVIDNSDITAKGRLDVLTQSEVSAKIRVGGIGLSFAYAEAISNAEITIKNGANLNATNDIKIAAGKQIRIRSNGFRNWWRR